jgi:hypothetical protein
MVFILGAIVSIAALGVAAIFSTFATNRCSGIAQNNARLEDEIRNLRSVEEHRSERRKALANLELRAGTNFAALTRIADRRVVAVRLPPAPAASPAPAPASPTGKPRTATAVADNR